MPVVQPPPGLGELLRLTRRKLGLTLREVCRRLAERGEQVPPSTLSRIEQGKLEPNVRRLFLLLELYDVPAFVASELVKQASRGPAAHAKSGSRPARGTQSKV